jgi:hypothetical protein
MTKLSRPRRATATVPLLAAMLVSSTALAEATYVSGRITNVTSGPAGLLIMLDAGVPTNCAGASYNWMVIPEANKTMIAVALITWQNQGSATVYTNALDPTNGCVINQFDPISPYP